MTVLVKESVWARRNRIFLSATMLGAMFGAISGALALPLMTMYQERSLRYIAFIAFAPVTGFVGLGLGVKVGAVIGVPVAAIDMRARGHLAIVVWVRSVILAATIAFALVFGFLSRFSVTWFVIPGALAIVLGQVGARWLIRAAER